MDDGSAVVFAGALLRHRPDLNNRPPPACNCKSLIASKIWWFH